MSTQTRDYRTVQAYREITFDCTCHVAGSFCPAHGTYQPATEDLEIRVEVMESSRSRRMTGRWRRDKSLEQ